MSNPLHNEIKKEFQLERLILFSDAVFAIAITLLVIEIRIPELPEEEHLTEKALRVSLAHLIPKFIGFLVGFIIIGVYWIAHHRLYKYVANYTGKLIWLNLFFLLFVALMPFSSGFFSEYFLMKTPFIFYAGNIVFLGVTNFFVWKYVSNPKHQLTEGLNQKEAIYYTRRSIGVPIIFVVAALLYLIHPIIAMVLLALIPFILKLLKKK